MAESKFHHEEILRGKNLVQTLGGFRLVLCGAGAIGGNLLETLARQGFSNICLIDFDRVDEHNINTQPYRGDDVGALKVNAMQSIVFDTVGVEIDVVSKKLEGNNAKKLLKDADLVVDGFDNSKSRQLVKDVCADLGVPCLHAGLDAEYGEVVWNEKYTVPKDAEGDVCDYPLARNLIMIVVSIAAEEIMDFCLQKKPRRQNWGFTLNDLKISPY